MPTVEPAQDPYPNIRKLVIVVSVAALPVELVAVWLFLRDHDYVVVIMAGLVLAGITAPALLLVAMKRLEGRRDAMAAAAAALDLAFTPLATPGGLRPFELYRSGSRRNVAHGERDGVAVELFDYTYRKGGGKNSNSVSQTIALLDRPGLDLPGLLLRPEGILERLFDNGKDIDFRADEAFSRAYHLSGPSEPRIRALFDDRVRRHFVEHPGRWVETAGSTVLYCRAGRDLPPAELGAFLDEAMAAADLLTRA